MVDMELKRINSRRLIRHWVSLILWMGFIFWLSTDTFSSEHTASVIAPLLHFIMPSRSAQEIEILHNAIRKSAHMIEYFVLGILLFGLFGAFPGMMTKRKLRRWAVISFLVVVLYALSDEFHQSFVLSREPSLRDVGIDTIGGGLALFEYLLFYRPKGDDGRGRRSAD